MGPRVAPVEEAPFRLEVNGERLGVWTCTPEQLEAFAAGRLWTEGYAAASGDFLSIQVREESGIYVARARVPPARFALAQRERQERAAHGCGPLHYLRCAPELLRQRRRLLPLPPLETFPELFRALYAAADRYQDTGGVHAAALTDGKRLRFQAEDVGRHNVVDKVIGAALLTGQDPCRLGLVLSARVSADIALKCARAGIAWVASRSIPTSLAVEIAQAGALPLVARAAGKEARVFAAEPGPLEPAR
ncbi:MAG: formate dehydrogenase accessory sulfurtransferase FdhD [Gemmatimonadetes bacterium]|nr:formate dehydrogenase accessory sulfurtransferase FdhD [Gemmatimonadota bacterium]